MFKLALDAGHGINTSGKRCLASLDPNQTREWTLNSKIATRLQEKLAGYPIEILRVDDTTGKTDVGLTTRCNKANKWGADFYLSIHHNAGLNGKAGGGTEVYVYNGGCGQASLDWQKQIYADFCKTAPLTTKRSGGGTKQADFAVVRQTKMPAVLIECAFMDSPSDVPVILTEEWTEKSATALANSIITMANLGNPVNTDTTPASTQPTKTGQIDVTYQTWDDVKNTWLPNVVNNSDYAGILGHDICAVYANLSQGNITYKVHVQGGSWLPEVTNRSDYAGIFNKPIDAIAMKTDTGATLHYEVHTRGGSWLGAVTGYDINDGNNGYAGIIGKPVDGLRIWIGPITVIDTESIARQEAEARALAEKKAQEEAQAKVEEEARIKAEQEAKIKAEQEAAVKAAEEARLAEEARIKAEEEAKRLEIERKAAEEAKQNIIDDSNYIITEDEKKNVLSLLAEFIIKLIRTIFSKGE